MEENRQKQEKRYPSQVILTIRVVVGGYLDYLAYSIVTSGEEKSPLMYIPVVVFFILGTIIAAWSILYLVQGKYEGGKADHWEEDHPELIEEKEEEEESEDEESEDNDSAEGAIIDK